MTMTLPRLSVVAAVLQQDHHYFIQQRPPGKHMAGMWEFAGGKVEEGESAWCALVRELNEELGIVATRGEPLIQLQHIYSDRVIDLDVWRVVEWNGEPVAQEQQVTGWFSLDEIRGMPLLPADGPVLNAMTLPHRLLITPSCGADRTAFIQQLERAVTEHEHTLCILSQSGLGDEDYRALAIAAHEFLRRRNCALILHGASDARAKLARELGTNRLHVSASDVEKVSHHTKVKWSVSCHSRDELDVAIGVDAEFALLGSVTKSESKQGDNVLGWPTFRELVSASNLPVYATGGMQDEDEVRSRLEGAQGIAATGAWWFKTS